MFYQGYKRTTEEALADLFLSELEQKEYKLIKCGHEDTTALPIYQVFVHVEVYRQGLRIFFTEKHII